MIRIALYQPDIPQNLGAILRMAACLGLAVDIIEPCGFPLDDRRIRRAGMDYISHVHYTRYLSWPAYLSWVAHHRTSFPETQLILLSTKSSLPYTKFLFSKHAILLVGRESAGVPQDVLETADHTVTIPMRPETRSLNVAIAASIVASEALRQIQA